MSKDSVNPEYNPGKCGFIHPVVETTPTKYNRILLRALKKSQFKIETAVPPETMTSLLDEFYNLATWNIVLLGGLLD